jgi:threonine/homoserine/homoserine lactone efflux protein
MIDQLVTLVASFGLFVSPGPTNGLLAAAAAMVGRNKAVNLLVAQSLGYLLSISTVLLIADSVIIRQPGVAPILKLVAATYLAYIAMRLWKWDSVASNAKQPIGFCDVLLASLFNPKALIFAFGFMPSGQIDWFLFLATLILVLPITGTTWIVLGSQMRLLNVKRLTRLVAVLLAIGAFGIAAVAIGQIGR